MIHIKSRFDNRKSTMEFRIQKEESTMKFKTQKEESRWTNKRKFLKLILKLRWKRDVHFLEFNLTKENREDGV